MEVEELENETFSSDTVWLLMVNELRMLRRDVNDGLLRMEEKIDKLVSVNADIHESFIEYISHANSSSSGQQKTASAPVYINKSMQDYTYIDREKSVKAEETNLNGEDTNQVACTVHVDVTELPSGVTLESYNDGETSSRLLDEQYEDDDKSLVAADYSQLGKGMRVFNPSSGKKEFFAYERTEDGRYQCSLCSSSFSNTGNLRRHYHHHLNYKRYKCDICNKKFFRGDSLYNHAKRHFKNVAKTEGYEVAKAMLDKNFKCIYCKRSFCSSQTLDKHLRLHTGDKPYWCTSCNHTFDNDEALLQHKAEAHGPETQQAELVQVN